MKPDDSERVLRVVAMGVDPRDSIGSCDSKMARDKSLFSCKMAAGGDDVLALVLGVGGFKTTLL